MQIVNLVQNSPEWVEWRKAGIGGSDAPAIMGVSPYDTPMTLWMRRLGHLPPKEMSQAMQRGHDLEPIAREKAAEKIGMLFVPMCGMHKAFNWLRASFDGVEIGRRALMEIKAPAEEDHELALEGCVPAKYWPQVQHQMLVSGIAKTFYVSYRPEHGEGYDLAIVEVNADQEYQKMMFQTLHKWWKCLKENRMPVAEEEAFSALAWRPIKQLAKQYASMESELKKQVLEKAGVDGSQEVRKDLGAAIITVSKKKGEVDYEALFAAYGITEADKDRFRKEETLVTQVRATNHARARVTREQLLA